MLVSVYETSMEPGSVNTAALEDLSPYQAELAVASGSQLPVCPSTAHHRDLGRTGLLRLALIRTESACYPAQILRL